MNEPISSLANRDGEDAPAARIKRQKRDIHGWLVLDKPVGMTSTHAGMR
jgi:tRNA pseudouridine55 synthase